MGPIEHCVGLVWKFAGAPRSASSCESGVCREPDYSSDGEGGVVSSAPQPQPAQTRTGLSTTPVASVALRPAEVVSLTQQLLPVPLMTTSQYAAHSTQPEMHNLSSVLRVLEAASVARLLRQSHDFHSTNSET